ncbi:glycosyltransferase family 2 protein [Flavivirga eckloniae]|uniref:Glycosyl transferase n=1 Tax=Flavivirga eckloniae TaxID=1803846 RepID=A0A2K9PMC0_9FLAO|nr:galactosyltransferase-related protein [Flavivirga eckloniae]AUP78176.1 glycosyl transferase [Flavivirga eckloniae]
MITVVYPYRDRDLRRIENSLESLVSQTNTDFTVLFIDYGSKLEMAKQVEILVSKYDFATYYYAYNVYQPWNKSKALNFALNLAKTPYFFVADIDMIFHPEFINTSFNLIKTFSNVYFKVGFLSKEESIKQKKFEDYKIKFESTNEATGISLFNTNDLRSLNGFDENYHFWGAEDTDVHVRLKHAKKDIHFYSDQVLMLHQWHVNYVNSEQKALTAKLHIKGIVQRNHDYLKQVRVSGKIKANDHEIGKVIDKTAFNKIIEYDKPIIISNKKTEFDNWFYNVLCSNELKINIHVVFKEAPFFKSKKYTLKKMLGKNIPEYITLKTINDNVLSYVVSNLHTYNYVYKISDDLKSIMLKILV